MEDCIFCKILSGEIPAKLIHSDEDTAAFYDVNPQAPTHILIIPKQHIASSVATRGQNSDVWNKILSRAVEIAHDLNLDKDGYRMVINTGEQGGQTVPHLHLHLLAGRNLGWPPG